MITVFFLVIAIVAGLAFYLFSQRKGADSQQPHQELPPTEVTHAKRTGNLD